MGLVGFWAAVFHANKRMVSVFECRTSSSEVTVQRHRFLAVLAVEIDVEKSSGLVFGQATQSV